MLIIIIIVACYFLFIYFKNGNKKPKEEKAEVAAPLPKSSLLAELICLLKAYDFIGADNLFLTDRIISKKEYEELKADYVKKFFDERLKEKLGFPIEKEKALAVAKIDKNILVKARAGTGKSTAIAYKVYFLVRKENIKSEEIMILAFNKNAAVEIGNKIRLKFGLTGIKNTRTFHSLAYQIAKPKEKLLLDQDSYIQAIADRMLGKKIELETIRLFVQFIQRAKKSLMGPEAINEVSGNYRSKDFILLANKIYQEYTESLLRDGYIDFDDLILKAVEAINKTKGECKVNGVVINFLKFIAIDEYQDFSKLFSLMIQAIRKYNPSVRLFCVGDDMQAINSFAGSDLKYFNDFLVDIKNSDIAYLSTSYRSRKEIVDGSNRFIADNEIKLNCKTGNNGGEITVRYIQDARSKRSSEVEYLKLCREIIKDNPSKTIAILNRKNDFNEVALPIILKKLTHFDEYGDRVRVGTVHSFKGQEADIVILLEVCKSLFPLIHPYSELFRLFGQDYRDTLEEERHLFYVAITRAKEKLFILTERGKESNYIGLLRK